MEQRSEQFAPRPASGTNSPRDATTAAPSSDKPTEKPALDAIPASSDLPDQLLVPQGELAIWRAYLADELNALLFEE